MRQIASIGASVSIGSLALIGAYALHGFYKGKRLRGRSRSEEFQDEESEGVLLLLEGCGFGVREAPCVCASP